jgi:hypothetical protein
MNSAQSMALMLEKVSPHDEMIESIAFDVFGDGSFIGKCFSLTHGFEWFTCGVDHHLVFLFVDVRINDGIKAHVTVLIVEDDLQDLLHVAHIVQLIHQPLLVGFPFRHFGPAESIVGHHSRLGTVTVYFDFIYGQSEHTHPVNWQIPNDGLSLEPGFFLVLKYKLAFPFFFERRILVNAIEVVMDRVVEKFFTC